MEIGDNLEENLGTLTADWNLIARKNELTDTDQSEELGRGRKWISKWFQEFVINLWPGWKNVEEDYMIYVLSTEEFVDNVSEL